MTMKRILHCTLIFMVLVTSGCGFWADESTSRPSANSSSAPRTENKIDFASAARDVRNAFGKLKSPGGTAESATVKPVQDEIKKALGKLSEEELARCTDCAEETKNEAAQVRQNLTVISNALGSDSRKKIVDLDKEVRQKLQQDLDAQTEKLEALRTARSIRIETATPPLSQAQTDPLKNETDNTEWWNILVLPLQIIGAMVGLVLLASLLTYLWKRAWKTVEFNTGQVVARHLAATREAQPAYAPKLSSLSSAQAEVSSNLTELTTEVRSLARLVRESIATRRPDRNPSYGDGFNYQSHVEDVAHKEEPEFPVSAGDYLGKMTRFSNVVRPDFQNGILVNDPDGDGELVLIRDSRDETQPLFVVPRATQFHTKQDFYTYYQKYYDCVKPSAGDVWIIGPAVVEKVVGGWQLREKGMLEVR